MNAMILAAGLGTRMRPLTLTTPKPLIPVAGVPLIEHHLVRLANAGIKRVVINISWLAGQVVETLGDGSRWGLEICYSHEPTPLETAGGIYKALPLLCGGEQGEDQFLVINGDVYTEMPLSSLCKLTPSKAHVVLVDNPAHHPKGDFYVSGDDLDSTARPNGLLPTRQIISELPTELAEEQESGFLPFTFSGVSVLHRSLFDALADNEVVGLGALLRAHMANKSVEASVYRGYWQDVGTLERLHQLENYLEQQAATNAAKAATGDASSWH